MMCDFQKTNKKTNMINTYASAHEFWAPRTHTCTLRSKKPCLHINEIFLGQTLMIHLSRWSMRRAEDAAVEYRAEQRRGLSKGYKPEQCAACGYSNTASQWGEKQTKWKKAIEILESYAHTHLFLWLRYGAVTSCCLKFNEMHLRKRMKGRQKSEG